MAGKDEITKAERMLERRKEELQKKYHVNQMGVGYKIEKGKMTNRVAIIFYVKRKRSLRELTSEGITPIPKEIDGCETDVIEITSGFTPRKHSMQNHTSQ